MDVIWQQRTQKRALQKDILSKITQQRLITLGGKNIADYIKLIPNSVKEIISYEINTQEYFSQLISLQSIHRNVIVLNYDILNSPVYIEAFYDFDFMCGLPKCAHIVNKFKECAFSLTISHRPYKLADTPRLLADAVEETLKDSKQGEYILTNKYRYDWHIYKDGMPMSTIVKYHY